MRILGVAATTHGFAFAAVENRNRVVDLDHRRTPAKKKAFREALGTVIKRTRPLFVASDGSIASAKHPRKRLLAQTLADACAEHDIFVLWLDRSEVKALADVPRPKKWQIAAALARDFPDIARKFPTGREWWKGEDHRIGIFMALAASVAAWNRFRADGSGAATDQP